MGIRILPYRGGYRHYWYGEYREGGKLHQVRLPVKIAGVPPKSLSIKDEGSVLYEKSKAKALAEFEAFENERKRKGSSERLMEELIASKTGKKVIFHKLNDIGKLWNSLPRDKPLSEGRISNNLHMAAEFAAFCPCEYIYEVTTNDVKGFLEWLKSQGLAWTTIKSKMSFLSGAFEKFYRGETNPFAQVIKRNTDVSAKTIHRIPLTNEQIAALREAARGDELLYPLVECGLATGARLVDIVHMRKDNIDIKEGFVTYVAQKTGTVCDIPLFDDFRIVCEGIMATSDPSEPYLFPEAVHLYETNRTGLCDRGKRLFAKALFNDIGEQPRPTLVIDGKPKERMSAAKVYSLVDKQRFMPSKKERMKAVYDKYIVQGLSYRQIEKELGIPRSSIGGYLQVLERLTEDTLIRFDATHGHIADKLEMTRRHREGAKRAVSVYGWSSLRSTFCRLAIERGVDEKMIMRAAGHSNFKTTMTYYDNPTRAHQREVMKAKMSATAIGHMASPVATTILDMVSRLPIEQQRLLATKLEKSLGNINGETKQLSVPA